ncbi:hypothetical protein HJC23_005356 [Cyclotella cryptica]|uniref:GPI inositol-deacylase n=1 Tax=Cyclotella cryptica TaxID=29204 RepID=A0ABD3PDX6_9STRA
MQQPDAGEFVKAVIKEINGHIEHKRWKLIKRSEVPEDADVIPSVWAMRRKRDLMINEILKYKSRLNLHGGKQVYRMNYFETYAPVVTWFAIRLIIVMAILFTLSLRQIDFVQAYPQAPIETDMYMECPRELRHVTAGYVWNSYLVEKLRSIGFQPSLIDECVFFHDDVIFIVYVDNGIFLGPNDQSLTDVIHEISDAGLDIEDQGHPADYIGVTITKHSNGCIEFTQHALIDAIINDVNIGDAYTKPVPAKATQQLHAYKDSPRFDECDFNFNYRSVTGKLNYLTQTSCSDLLFATHQVAKYSSDPRKKHGEAIVYIVRYVKKTRHLGLKFRPNESKGFECYCNADFAGNWNKDFAQHDPSTAKSRSGWVIFYARYPIIRASKLQSQVALSTTEAEYIAMSMALRDVIPIMELMNEFRERIFKVICTQPQVYCKVFEDNSGSMIENYDSQSNPKLCTRNVADVGRLLEFHDNWCFLPPKLIKSQWKDVPHPHRGHPVLYVPRHWGTFSQARSIGVHGTRWTGGSMNHDRSVYQIYNSFKTDEGMHDGTNLLANKTQEEFIAFLLSSYSKSYLDDFVMDVFSLAFDGGEGVALHSSKLFRQAEFFARAVETLVEGCQLSNTGDLSANDKVQGITIVDHSIGAWVVRIALKLHPHLTDKGWVRNVITLASPLSSVPYAVDAGVHDIVNHLNDEYRGNDEVTFISISRGLRDEMIPPESCEIPFAFEDRTIRAQGEMSTASVISEAFLAITIMKVNSDMDIDNQYGMDHRAIVWCYDLLKVVRKVIFTLVSTTDQGMTAHNRLNVANNVMLGRTSHKKTSSSFFSKGNSPTMGSISD